MAPAAAAGWYDDPSDLGAFRWWSGAEWTTYTAPKTAPAAPSTYAALSRDPAIRQPYAPQVAVQPRGSAQTPGVWLFAFLPLMNIVLLGGIMVIVLLGGPLLPDIAAYPVVVGLAWLFGVLDVRALRRRGYGPPSLLWLLLIPPIAYLIVRGRSIRTQGGKAWPAEVVYLASFMIALIVNVLVVLAALAMTPAQQGQQSQAALSGQSVYAGTFVEGTTPSQTQLEALLADAIATDGSVIVDCSPSAPRIAPGAELLCYELDPVTTDQAQLDVRFCDCGDVFYTATPIVGWSGFSQYLDTSDNPMQQEDAGSIPDETQPLQPQIEQVLERRGYPDVDCSDAAPLMAHGTTFDCFGTLYDGTSVRLNVSISDIGNLSYTEYPLDAVAGQSS